MRARRRSLAESGIAVGGESSGFTVYQLPLVEDDAAAIALFRAQRIDDDDKDQILAHRTVGDQTLYYVVEADALELRNDTFDLPAGLRLTRVDHADSFDDEWEIFDSGSLAAQRNPQLAALDAGRFAAGLSQAPLSNASVIARRRQVAFVQAGKGASTSNAGLANGDWTIINAGGVRYDGSMIDGERRGLGTLRAGSISLRGDFQADEVTDALFDGGMHHLRIPRGVIVGSSETGLLVDVDGVDLFGSGELFRGRIGTTVDVARPLLRSLRRMPHWRSWKEAWQPADANQPSDAWFVASVWARMTGRPQWFQRGRTLAGRTDYALHPDFRAELHNLDLRRVSEMVKRAEAEGDVPELRRWAEYDLSFDGTISAFGQELHIDGPAALSLALFTPFGTAIIVRRGSRRVAYFSDGSRFDGHSIEDHGGRLDGVLQRAGRLYVGSFTKRFGSFSDRGFPAGWVSTSARIP